MSTGAAASKGHFVLFATQIGLLSEDDVVAHIRQQGATYHRGTLNAQGELNFDFASYAIVSFFFKFFMQRLSCDRQWNQLQYFLLYYCNYLRVFERIAFSRSADLLSQTCLRCSFCPL
jgi:hypothetical protein